MPFRPYPPRPDRAFPVRVRRRLDNSPILHLYGAQAVAALPEEIIDLADGTRVCEWPDEIVRMTTLRRESPTDRDERVLSQLIRDEAAHAVRRVFDRTVTHAAPVAHRPSPEVTIELRADRRIRYRSEEDMWRGLAMRASRAPFAPPHFTVSAATCAAWRAPHRRRRLAAALAAAMLSVRKKTAAFRFQLMFSIPAASREPIAQAIADAQRTVTTESFVLSDAWVVRDRALAALIDFDGHALPIVAIQLPEETDDRELDSMGRPNSGGAAGKARRR